MKKIIIIPAYEPDDNLAEIVEGAAQSECDVILIDDGSGEKYAGIFEKATKYANHFITYPENRGKGYAMKTAYKYISETYSDYAVAAMDSDGQHLIKDVLNVLDYAIEHPGTLVLGSRKGLSQSPAKSRFGNGVTRKIYSLSTGIEVYDTQTGLRAFDSSLMNTILEIPGDRYEFEMNELMILAKNQTPIEEIPIDTIYIDNNSGTHFRPIKDSLAIYKEILRFSASSLAGFVVDYIFYTVLLLVLGKGMLLICNVGARVVSATVNFTLNYKYVFKSKDSVLKCAVKYVMLALGILTANTVILCFFVEKRGFNPYVSKIVVEVIMYLVSWTIQRLFVFGKKER